MLWGLGQALCCEGLCLCASLQLAGAAGISAATAGDTPGALCRVCVCLYMMLYIHNILPSLRLRTWCYAEIAGMLPAPFTSVCTIFDEARHADGPPQYGLSLQAMIRVAGTGVSPFNTTKQATLVVSLGSVMTTVTQDEIGVILVQAATSATRRRALLDSDLEEVSRDVLKCNAILPS